MALHHSPKIVTDGLVLALDAGNTRSYSGSGSSWIDLIGSNNGTLSGPSFISTSPKAFEFNSSLDKVTFTHPTSASSNQSYEIWFNGTAISGASLNFGYILHNNNSLSGDGNNVGDSYAVIGSTDYTRINNTYFAAFNAQWSAMDTGVIVSSVDIFQIVLTWDGSTQRAYVNGIERVSQSLTTTPQNFDTITALGESQSGSGRTLDGKIFSCKIYNKALTDGEVLQNYNANKGRFGL